MIDLAVFILAIILLWLGSGISVSGVGKVSKSLRISSFFTSFLILGLLTSVSEISVAFFSILNKSPDISAGNLIGASVVLTLLIIPLLAIFNKGVKIDDRTEYINFNVAYLIISLPALLALDKIISFFDVGIMLCSFAFLGITINNKSSLWGRLEKAIIHPKVNVLREGLKVVLGVVMIIIASKFIVDLAVSYSQNFSVSPFLVGLLILSIGTNLPETAVLVRSTLAKKKNIALGDYVGSAVLNTLIICALVIFNGSPIYLATGVRFNLLLLPLGSALFLYFSRDGKLERREGLILILLYVGFIVSELLV